MAQVVRTNKAEQLLTEIRTHLKMLTAVTGRFLSTAYGIIYRFLSGSSCELVSASPPILPITDLPVNLHAVAMQCPDR